MHSSLLRAVAAGAASGFVASWVMERAQERIQRWGSKETKRREAEAQGDLEPATYRAAERVAAALGRTIDDDRKATAGEVVHFVTGTLSGAALGVVAHALGTRGLVPGLVFGALVWLLNDELLVPALGLSKLPTRYPASTHAKALAAHLVYGATTGSGLRLLTR